MDRAFHEGDLEMTARELVATVRETIHPSRPAVPATRRLSRIAGQFRLEPLAARTLMFLFLSDRFGVLADAVEELGHHGRMEIIAAAVRGTPGQGRDIAGTGGVLQRRCLTRRVRADGPFRHNGPLEEYVSHYLSGEMGESIVDFFCQPLDRSDLSVDEFPVSPRAIEISRAQRVGRRAIRVRRSGEEKPEDRRASVDALLAATYELGPGAVDRCLAVASRVESGTMDVLPHVLERHAQLARGGPAPRRTVGRLFDPGLCESSVGLDQITTAARRFASARKDRTASTADRAGAAGGGLALLLSGEPGTGKSAYAAYLAGELSLPLLEKRASDLVSPYVGQTESNSAAAFAEARDRDAVLLLDEADSFLSRRDGAHQSWQVSHVNELLKQMELHSGILVCCTNLPDLVDFAAMRRFTRYFPETRLTATAASRLERLTGLLPGDFAVVERRFAWSEPAMAADDIVNALEEERSYRAPDRRRVGFVASGSWHRGVVQ